MAQLKPNQAALPEQRNRPFNDEHAHIYIQDERRGANQREIPQC